jgi:hypothetical protein
MRSDLDRCVRQMFQNAWRDADVELRIEEL